MPYLSKTYVRSLKPILPNSKPFTGAKPELVHWQVLTSKIDSRSLLNEVGLTAAKSLTCKSAAMLSKLCSDLTDSLSRKKNNDIKYNTNCTVLKLLKNT